MPDMALSLIPSRRMCKNALRVATFIAAAVLVVLLMGMVVTLGGCTNLPPNPTPAQILTAQDRITNQQIAYSLVTTPIIASLKGDNRIKALAADKTVRDLFGKAYDDADAGRNVNFREIAQSIDSGERAIMGLPQP